MLKRLIEIVKKLRLPGGCQWDIAQTFQSLRPHIIEEAYELADAMSVEDMSGLREELGDVLLHVVMLSRIAEEKGSFSIANVIEGVSEKMIRRHPHVFGDKVADTVEDVWENWETVKKQENSSDKGIFDSIPKALPALMKANKVQKRAARQGFDWESIEGPLLKVDEERLELIEAIQANDRNAIEEEFGDLLFAAVNLARKLDIEPEGVLAKATQKFMERYKLMENCANIDGVELNELNNNQLDAYWNQVKKSF